MIQNLHISVSQMTSQLRKSDPGFEPRLSQALSRTITVDNISGNEM